MDHYLSVIGCTSVSVSAKKLYAILFGEPLMLLSVGSTKSVGFLFWVGEHPCNCWDSQLWWGCDGCPLVWWILVQQLRWTCDSCQLVWWILIIFRPFFGAEVILWQSSPKYRLLVVFPRIFFFSVWRFEQADLCARYKNLSGESLLSSIVFLMLRWFFDSLLQNIVF